MAAYSHPPSVFETYVCKEPAGEASLLINNGPDQYTALVRTLQRSAEHFSEKDQRRVVERIHYEQARLHMQHQNWKHAMRILLPLWQTLSWRKSGWWLLLEEVDCALQECARNVQDVDTLIAVQWELLNSSLTPRQETKKPELKDMIPPDTRPKIKLRAESVLSGVSAKYAFSKREGNVSVPLRSQLTLTSHARDPLKPLLVRRIQVAFEGGLKNIQLDHKNDGRSAEVQIRQRLKLQDVDLQKISAVSDSVPAIPVLPANTIVSSAQNTLYGQADLSLPAGTSKIFSLLDTPRDAGEVEVSSITIVVEEGTTYDVEILTTDSENMQQDGIFVKNEDGICLRLITKERSSVINILPKLPRLKIAISDPGREYFLDEISTILVDLVNDEEDEVDVKLDLRILGSPETAPSIRWLSELRNDNPLEEQVGNQKTDPHLDLGTLSPAASQSCKLRLEASSQPSEHMLEIRASYSIKSDPETPIVKSVSTDINICRPFEATYSFSPLIHPDAWPNYFEISDAEGDDDSRIESKKARGLMQRWLLTARILSLATLSLTIESAEIEVTAVQEAAYCTSTALGVNVPADLQPGEVQEHQYSLDVQKLDIEDRRPTYVDYQLKVLWRPLGSPGPPISAILPIPELAMPFGEPRVLASVHSRNDPPGVIQLHYVLENPSIYSLTFNIVMETSDEFAFSGAKSTTLQLVPLSRQLILFNLLPQAKGTWINPQLRVYDVHFHKNLKVVGTEGIRNDRRGISIWVDADG